MWLLPFRRRAMYHLEHQGSCWICCLQTKKQSSNSNISNDSLTPTLSKVSKRCMERMSILRLFRCWFSRIRFFGTFFPGYENAGRSAICIYRDLEEAIVTKSLRKFENRVENNVFPIPPVIRFVLFGLSQPFGWTHFNERARLACCTDFLQWMW